MSETVFSKIISGQLPARIVYEDDQAVAFHDVQPVAPTHILVIPRTPIERLSKASKEHAALLGHLLLVANRVAADAGLSDFRVVINDGAGVGQTVFHLHIHVLGGRAFTWPPG